MKMFRKSQFHIRPLIVIVLFGLLFILYLISTTTITTSYKFNINAIIDSKQEVQNVNNNNVISRIFSNNISPIKLYQNLTLTTKTQNETLSLSKDNNDYDDFMIKKLPMRVQLNNSETYKLAEEESNLPMTFWERWKNFPKNKKIKQHYNESVIYCDKIELIDPFNVQFNNRYWQMFTIKPNSKTSTINNNTKKEEEEIVMYLYNAYYDNRTIPVVRLIAVNRQEPLAKKLW